VFSKNSNARSAYLVAGITVSGHPVAACKNRVYPAIFHYLGCHVVAYYCGINSRGRKLKGRKPNALKKGAGFIGKDF
jgi:hypothetical protein